MIPLGILSQKTGGIAFININGTYWEDSNPSTPSWGAGYNEYELRYVTSNDYNSIIFSSPNIDVDNLNLTLQGAAFTEYLPSISPGADLSSRIMRSIGFSEPVPPVVEMSVTGFKVGDKVKIHYLGNVTGDDLPAPVSLRLIIKEAGVADETILKNWTEANSFIKSPYDTGGDVAWGSSTERTMTTTSLALNFTRGGGSAGYLNAIAIEILK